MDRDVSGDASPTFHLGMELSLRSSVDTQEQGLSEMGKHVLV